MYALRQYLREYRDEASSEWLLNIVEGLRIPAYVSAPVSTAGTLFHLVCMCLYVSELRSFALFILRRLILCVACLVVAVRWR